MTYRIVLALLVALYALPASAGQRHIVEIVSDYENLQFYFKPRVLTIQPGDTVIFVNQSDEDHNIISYPNGYPMGATPMNSPIMSSAGETFEHTFPTAGTYHYHCTPHLLMGMRAEIIVGRQSLAEEINRPTLSEVRQYTAHLLEWFDEDDHLFDVRDNVAKSHDH